MAEDDDKKKAKADKAAREAAEKEAAEPQLPEPSQEEADAIKEGVAETRDVEAQSPKSSYKTR